jgi:uncharacterized protein YbjT (DUF2867 family)
MTEFQTLPAPGLSLVFGASGYVGTNLVERLLREGRPVRAVARNLKVLEAREWQGADLAQADALAPETLPAALAGVQIAYYLVHSMAAGRNFGQLDLQAAKHFADAAAAAGVQRIVYLGGLVPHDADSEHLVSRRQTGEVLRQGAVPVTELRAGIIVGAGSAAYEVMRDLVNHVPWMVTPRWVTSRSSPLALDNLLTYLVRLPLLAESAGGIYDAGGPEYMSYQDMMLAFARVVGKTPRIIPVPWLSPAFSAMWLGLVTTVPANIARALIGGLKHDIPADDAALRQLVPQPLLGFTDAANAAMHAEQQHTVAARWTEGRLMFRGNRLDHAFYAKRAGGAAETAASVPALWRVVSAMGGDNRYYTLNWLWWLREAMDWVLGGPGFTRGRRDPEHLRLGDTIDYWTVIGLAPPHRLTLNFGLQAPGNGVLEFEIETLAPGRNQITVTAYWHPRGVWGLLYWYALVPAHLFLFKRFTRVMAQRALLLDRQALPGP